MGVPIPHYLKGLAVLKSRKNTWVHFSIKCACGSDNFFVYENYLNPNEKVLEKPYYDALTEMFSAGSSMCTRDEDGTLHHWKLYEPSKGLKGKHEEILLPDRPYFSGIVVIKIKCADCGKEYLLFDSRIHGYDGMTSEETKETMEYEPHFRLKCKNIVSLELKVENNESFEEFNEDCDLGFTQEQYSNSFSWIWIYKIDEKGKKTKIFDYETA